MVSRFKFPATLVVLCLGAFLLVPSPAGAQFIAQITQFQGDVVVLTDTEFKQVNQVGFPLNSGDRVQTKNGEAQITFNDGAVMKVRAFTSTMIQEAEEETGWLFKAKNLVRRITCQVGTLWFKSGTSKRRNYLQSPTAVCGLRGTIAEFGFDNVMTFLREIEGATEIEGKIEKVTEQFFRNMEANSQRYAQENKVYDKLAKAFEKAEKAKDTGTDVDKAGAKVAALDAIQASLLAILANESLSGDAKDALESMLRKVNENLKDATTELNTLTEQPTTTVPGATTTTTTVAPETTTTTAAPTTTTVSIPTTTTTTSSTTTTTSAASPTTLP
jgi:hypothetical protein